MAEPTTIVENGHAGYIVRLPFHRSMVLTAQQLLDIMDYALLHAEQLRKEAAKAEEFDRRSKGLSVGRKQDGRAHQPGET